MSDRMLSACIRAVFNVAIKSRSVAFRALEETMVWKDGKPMRAIIETTASTTAISKRVNPSLRFINSYPERS